MPKCTDVITILTQYKYQDENNQTVNNKGQLNQNQYHLPPPPPPPSTHTTVPPIVYGFDEVVTHVLLHMYYYTCRVQSCVYKLIF